MIKKSDIARIRRMLKIFKSEKDPERRLRLAKAIEKKIVKLEKLL